MVAANTSIKRVDGAEHKALDSREKAQDTGGPCPWMEGHTLYVIQSFCKEYGRETEFLIGLRDYFAENPDF